MNSPVQTTKTTKSFEAGPTSPKYVGENAGSSALAYQSILTIFDVPLRRLEGEVR